MATRSRPAVRAASWCARQEARCHRSRIPAELHVAGVNEHERLVLALDDARLAAALRERGYDPGRLIVGELADGAFRPLSPAELEAADVFARRPASRRAPRL